MCGAGPPLPSSKMTGSSRVALLREMGVLVMSSVQVAASHEAPSPETCSEESAPDPHQTSAEFSLQVQRCRERIRSMSPLRFHLVLILLRLSALIASAAYRIDYWPSKPPS